MIDLKQLEALMQVAQCESFSLAAEKLHITQPAITKRVQLLERSIGTPLIDRHQSKLALTAAGDIIAQLGARVELEIEDSLRQIQDLDDGVRGTLQIAISHHLGLHRLPEILREYSHLYPDVEMQIEFTDSEKAHDAVARGEHDLAIVTLSPHEHANVVRTEIWPDPMTVVVDKQHELAAKQVVELSDLADYPAVLPGLNTYTGQIAQRMFEQEQLNLKLAMSTNYLETVAMLVSIGQGWSVLPSAMIDDSLCELQTNVNWPARSLGYVTHISRPQSKASQALQALLLKRKS